MAIVLIGNNNLNTGESAADIYAEIVTLLKRLRQDGHATVLMTVTPSSFQPPGSDWDNRRLALNTLIMANAGGVADMVYDLSALLPDPTDSTWYVDGTHYTPAGNQRIANALYTAIKTRFSW